MIFTGIIPWVILGYLGGLIFARKGYPPRLGIILGIVLGPIGLVVFAMLPMTGEGARQSRLDDEIELQERINARLKDCPQCKRTVGFSSRFCPRCNYRFPGHAAS